MKKVDAETHIEVMCHCPYCNSYQDVLENVRDVMDHTMRSENCDVEVRCDECRELFIVENVVF